ncbi:MAG: transposase [Sedimentisphaerales bacterium]|jgi:putative transposase
MPRLARTVAIDYPHHITQRGNNQQDVFFVKDDWRVYLKLLKEQCDKYGMEINAYCLMRNHVHLIGIPHNENSLAKAIGGTHFQYTQYINRMHKRSGHLWQGRFYSCALDEKGFWLAAKYIELNPVHAKICRLPWQYEWSSAASHVDSTAASKLLNLAGWYKMISDSEWRKELTDGIDEKQISVIRSNTHVGRPIGTDSFISKLENMLGRRIRPLPVGRPYKNVNIDK